MAALRLVRDRSDFPGGEGSIPLAASLAAFRTDQERRGLTQSTIYRRASDVRAFDAAMPGGIFSATEDDVQRFLDKRHISARTRYSWLSNLHCFFVVAAKTHPCTDPTLEILRPKLPRYLPRPIGDGDLAMGLERAGTMMQAWLTLMAYAGLRCSEVARLQRNDVLDGPQLLRIFGKGGKERLVPIHPEVTCVLRLVGMPRTGYLFRRPRGGPYTPANVSRETSLYFASIGVDATAHQLRHWFGTKTYAACHDIRVVQELLGHASPTTTSVYVAFSREDAAAAVLSITIAA